MARPEKVPHSLSRMCPYDYPKLTLYESLFIDSAHFINSPAIQPKNLILDLRAGFRAVLHPHRPSVPLRVRSAGRDCGRGCGRGLEELRHGKLVSLLSFDYISFLTDGILQK